MKVRLVLDDGAVYATPGKLLFSDARVDAHTGQVTLRGEFPNPKRELLPGMYVRVLIEQGIDTDAIALPQQALQRKGGGGSNVFVVEGFQKFAAGDKVRPLLFTEADASADTAAARQTTPGRR